VILIVSLIVSAILGVVLIVLAAMFDGMSHSSKSMYTLFPYGTSVVMRTRWSSIGLVLLVIQFPLYALILNLVRLRWKAVALVLIVAIHVLAVVLGMLLMELRSYAEQNGPSRPQKSSRPGTNTGETWRMMMRYVSLRKRIRRR
jgi:hypothetical protein